MTKRRPSRQREVRPPSRQQRLEQQQERQSQQNRYISIAAGVLIVAVILIVAWQLISRQTSTAGDEPGAVMEGERPLAALDPTERNAFYSQYPEMVIDTAKEYEAVIRTNKGDMRLTLFDEEAPQTVNSFVYLANQGFYDGVVFHRVLPNFMAQGGDPLGAGTGGPGYSFVNENSEALFDRRGLLAMANSGPDTNGSQFFITFGPQPDLNGGYTIFGELTEGDEVLSAITLIDPTGQQAPADATPDVIERIDIIEQ